MDQYSRELHWFAFLTRLSIASLLLVAGILKIPGGIEGTVQYFTATFQNSMVPLALVKAHASVIMFIEIALGLWLLTGYRMRWAWVASGLLLLSLAVGIEFAGKYDVASDNFLYVFYCGVGLLLSRHDRWTLDSRESSRN